jgi:DNA-binding MarR family transcriptional regulator
MDQICCRVRPEALEQPEMEKRTDAAYIMYDFCEIFDQSIRKGFDGRHWPLRQAQLLEAIQSRETIGVESLSKILGWPRATVSAVVKISAARGLITSSRRWRRNGPVQLTDEGLAFLRAVRGVLGVIENRILGALSLDDQRKFTALLGQIAREWSDETRPRFADAVAVE